MEKKVSHKYEHLFQQMRDLSAKIDRTYEIYRKLAPKNGEIPVGGAHIDEWVKIETMEAVLRGMRQEKEKEEIVEAAKGAYIAVIERWNAKREYQVHRSTCGADMFVQNVIKKVGLV